MEGKRIKWGNIIIVLLIICAGVAAYFYKNPINVKNLFNSGNNTTEMNKDVNNNDVKDNKTQDDQMPNPDEFVMGLDSWIGGTPVLVGLNREYNKDYSLNLKVKYIPNDGDRILALKEGEIQATEMSLPAFTRFQEKYPGVGVIVGITDFSRGADGIVAKTEIKNLNDMEDKRVSYVADGTGKFILNKFLRLTGLRYQDIKPIERKEMSEVVNDLKSGNADLIVSWSPDMNLAVKEINSAKPNSVRLLITTKEVPNLIPTVLVVNKNVLSSNPERVESFLKTWYASSKYIIEKPDKAYGKLVELMNEHKDEYGEVAEADVKDSLANIKLMSLNDNFGYFGLSSKEDQFTPIINDTVQTLKKYGDINKTDIMSGEVLDISFVKKLKDSNEEELLIAVLDSAITGNTTQKTDEKKEFKKQDEVSIEKNTEKVAKVDIPPVYYDTGKATVKNESITVLNEVVSILKQFPEYYLIVDAHTDSVGDDSTNLLLSKARADTVKQYLITKGIEVNRMVARGWGEYRPIVSGEKTEGDRAKNRRTEFTLTRDTAGQ